MGIKQQRAHSGMAPWAVSAVAGLGTHGILAVAVPRRWQGVGLVASGASGLALALFGAPGWQEAGRGMVTGTATASIHRYLAQRQRSTDPCVRRR